MAELSRAAQALAEWWDWAGVESASAPIPPPPAKAPAPAARSARPAPAAPAQGAREAAASARTLAELHAAIENFDGCGLKATARSTVVSDGTAASEALLIGEAPGRDEDEQGLPFVGRSGQLLDRMLGAVGFDRKTNLLISNVVFWRPPGNRPPTQAELAICLPFVDRLIALQQPKLLILSGAIAAKTVLRREEGVTRLRGRRLRFSPPEGGEPVNALVMLHPAYLLRRPQEKRLAWADLLMLDAWAEELGLQRGARP
ncbi:MAG: uracil-DNA glycosylase family protein [Hyphomonadaceae bacterium]